MANVRELYMEGIEAYNAHDLDRFIEIYSDDCELTVPGFPTFKGKAAVRECWRLFMESFPDDHLTVSNQIVEGMTAVGEWKAEATNTGPLYLPSGEVLPPTGKHYINRGIDVAAFEDGRVKSHRLYWDTTEILAQLGLMPEAVS
ncbi:MAG: ester cyclase [Candidatus Dormibacteraeota bacterium]|nr:ester cyclase [Candidatus Dormibacteraeota bacterium]